jgi:hypothetical protein
MKKEPFKRALFFVLLSEFILFLSFYFQFSENESLKDQLRKDYLTIDLKNVK